MKKTLGIIISLLLVTFCTSCSNGTSAPIAQNDNRESSNQAEDNLSSPDTTSDSVEEESLSISDTTSDSAVSVEDDSELIEDNYEAEQKEKERLYKKAKKMYLSGKWDGTKPIKLGSRTISRSETFGDILIDDYQVYSCQEYIDLPKSFNEDKSSSRTEYIHNQGVYVIEDRTLVKYVRGKKIMLGEPLKWKGLNPQNKGKYGSIADDEMIHGFPYIRAMDLSDCIPYLYYYKEANQLILVTTDPLKKCQYLYIFPDYNVSQIKYLGKIAAFSIWRGTDVEDKFYYMDMKGTTWLYTKNGSKKVAKEMFY